MAKRGLVDPPAPELIGIIPEPDEVGKAAIEYLSCVSAEAQAKEDKTKAAEDLTTAMIRADRRSIKIRGKNILLDHVEEKDVLRVK